MTAAINAKSEALALHELSSEELDAVSGGDALGEQAKINEQENRQQERDNLKATQAMEVFSQILNDL